MKPRPLPGFRLVGEDGNAFAIMGRFCRAAKKAKLDSASTDAVIADAQSGDYGHLLATFIPWNEEENEEEDTE